MKKGFKAQFKDVRAIMLILTLCVIVFGMILSIDAGGVRFTAIFFYLLIVFTGLGLPFICFNMEINGYSKMTGHK